MEGGEGVMEGGEGVMEGGEGVMEGGEGVMEEGEGVMEGGEGVMEEGEGVVVTSMLKMIVIIDRLNESHDAYPHHIIIYQGNDDIIINK